MIDDVIAERYSLKKRTNSCGESFSDIDVKPSMSEKKHIRCFSCPSRFTFPCSRRISSAIFDPTYSLSAWFSFFLFLSSIRYFTIFAEVKAKIRENTISDG